MIDTETQMGKSLDALHHALSKLRTGRAHPSLLDQVSVDYYGTPTPLKQVANISVLDARTLQVEPWEKTLVPNIEKAIMKSDLGLNPSTSGQVIRIPLPVLTEERRKEFSKLVRGEGEKAKISVRNARREANENFKKQLKAKDISEDEERSLQGEVQKSTDKYISEIDKLVVQKEKDLMAV